MLPPAPEHWTIAPQAPSGPAPRACGVASGIGHWALGAAHSLITDSGRSPRTLDPKPYTLDPKDAEGAFPNPTPP